LGEKNKVKRPMLNVQEMRQYGKDGSMKNISLLGFMGTGKTTIGLGLACALGWDFVDTDSLIEQKMGMSIANIFKEFGEKRFRLEEKEVIAETARKVKQVISTGGGVVLDKENIDCLRNNSVLICLEASPDVIYERVGGDNSRPLLRGPNPLKHIRDLLKAREPYYRCADFYVNTSNINIQEAVEKILTELGKWGIKINSNETYHK
jgi:shikimate kinase